MGSRKPGAGEITTAADSSLIRAVRSVLETSLAVHFGYHKSAEDYCYFTVECAHSKRQLFVEWDF